jgi:hypothetical protein
MIESADALLLMLIVFHGFDSHPKLVSQTLTNHRLPAFLGFRFSMTVHAVTLPSHFVLEAKTFHPPECSRH